MTTALSLIGIISLLAGGVVEGALRYANVIKCRYIASFLVVPGLYTVSIKLLKRCNNRLAFILSPGDRESRKKILGFESSGNYKYVGMRSGTNVVVANALFESWVNVASRTKPTKEHDSAMKRIRPKMGGKSTLRMTKCKLISIEEKNAIINICEPWFLAVPVVLQLGAIAVFVLTAIDGNTAGITISIINMAVYFMINIFVTRDKLSVPIPDPTANVPPGDMVVTNKLNNNIWVVKGDERDIQSIAQREIDITGHAPEMAETLVYIAGSLIAIATILIVPIMSRTAQIYIAIQFGIGLLSSIAFSSRDGEMMLKRLLEKHYNMEKVVTTTFTNRATAVAASAFSTDANVRYINNNMVPDTQDYDKYRRVLQMVINDMGIANTQLQALANKLKLDANIYGKGLPECDQKHNTGLTVAKYFINALPCATEMLPDGHLTTQNINTWPGRLLMDIIEAFVQIYGFES